MKKDRAQTARGVHVDEILKSGLNEADVRKIIGQATPSSPNQTLTGTPQPGTPYVVATGPFSPRVGKDGLISVVVRFTSLAQTLRRFWITHKKIKRDGTYAKPVVQRVVPTDADIAANNIEVLLAKGIDPHRQYDLVFIEAKLSDDPTNDGGNRDTLPNPYIEATAPGVPAGSSVALASLGPFAGQPGNKVDNYCQNAKFKWNSADWMNQSGSSDGAGIVDPASLIQACAKWRYAVDNTRGLSTVVANGNYWSLTGSFAGQLTMTNSNPLFDPSSRMLHAPYSPGQGFNVAFTGLMGGLWSATEQAFILTCSLYDEGTAQTVATTSMAIGPQTSRSEWRFIQMPLVNCSTSWVPVGAAKQWVRWHLSGTLAAGHNLHIDKVLYSDQQGAWSANPSDLNQENPPSVATPVASGTVGQGDQPGSFDPGQGGFYIPNTE